MKVRVTSELPCAADHVWQAVKTPALLEEITYPLVTFKSLGGSKILQQRSVWPHGETVYLYSYLFGLVPLGKRSLRLESLRLESLRPKIDDDTRTI